MVDKEKKAFTVKDKRFFTEKEGRKDEVGAEQKKSPPLPEVSFNGLIFSLSSSALIYLGEVPDPNTNKKAKDLELAKHTIDTISMLKEKTKGNLTQEEERFLDSVLADLRWKYVKASGL